MHSLFLFLFNILSILTNSQIGCMKGRSSSQTNAIINGEYILSNGEYSKTIQCNGVQSTLYLFKCTSTATNVQNRFVITSTSGSTNCGGFLARCLSTTINNAEDCPSWEVGGSEDQLVTFTATECLSTNCGTLLVTPSPNVNIPCSGSLIYEKKNLFTNNNNNDNYWLIYNHVFSKWGCFKDVNERCNITYYGYAQNEGYNTLNTNTNINWIYGQLFTNTFTCSGTPLSRTPTMNTLTPTSNPIKAIIEDDICFFDHISVTTDHKYLNGFYKYSGYSGGLPYYVKNNNDQFVLCSGTNPPANYYMHYVNPTWYLSSALNTNDVKAKCTIDGIQNPIQCGNLWGFDQGMGNFQTDPNTKLYQGSCPSIPCQQGISWTNTYCTGPFTERVLKANDSTQEYLYVYRNPSNNHYLFFNELKMKWQCETNPSQFRLAECIFPEDQQSGQMWYDFTNNETPIVPFLKGADSKIICYSTDSPTKIPTKMPSKNPTSKNPSKTPTKMPSISPSKNPTKQPSHAPIKKGDPTRSPTKNPIQSPTEAPYKPGTPSKVPTQNTKTPSKPTFKPTQSPNEDSVMKISVFIGFVLVFVNLICTLF